MYIELDGNLIDFAELTCIDVIGYNPPPVQRIKRSRLWWLWYVFPVGYNPYKEIY